MKNYKHACSLAAVLTMICTVDVHARDTALRQNIDGRSRSSLVGRATVKQVLQNNGTRGGAVADALLNQLASKLLDGQEHREQIANGGQRIIAGNGAYLEVSADGSAGQYYQAHALTGIAVDARLGDDALIHAARKIVESQLAPAVGIASAELMPLMVRHQIQSSIDRASGATTREVVSSEVVFGRMLDGVPVIGPGSKIFVELSTKGELLTYRYDWSQFTVNNVESPVASMQTVLERAREYTRAPAPDVNQFSRFECGYFDQGSGRSSLPLQSACLVQRVQRDTDGHVTEAVEEYVPAGASVAVDPAWPLSALVKGQDVIGPGVEVPAAGPAKP